jgi:FGFR1 oncogene partner
MQKESNSLDIQQEAKEIIVNELEKKGVINYMRAKIKKSIIDIINNQKESFKQKLDFDFMTPLHRLNKPKEIVLVCQLIKEFLKFYELEYTLPIFENESNIKEDIKRETLLKELKLGEKKDTSKPVLLLLLQDKLSRKEENQVHKNIDRYEYNKSDGELSNSEINKNQLNPSSFGSTNKSLDMTEPSNINKFNTFNMNEFYKDKAKNNSNGNIIDEEEKKVEKNAENDQNLKNDNNLPNAIKGSDSNNNKSDEGKEKIKNNRNNIIYKYNDQYQEAIIEEISGRDMREKDKDKEDNKNIESQSNQAYESTASDNK